MSPNQTPTARYVQVAQGVPLIAALVAPLVSTDRQAEPKPLASPPSPSSTSSPVRFLSRQICLLDIPALSQRWFNTPEGGPQPDPVGSIVLSAFSLGE